VFFAIDTADSNIHNELSEWVLTATINLNSRIDDLELRRKLQITPFPPEDYRIRL
jgi:hypothetical protein